ncbi:MAG: hypothetical protein LBN99_08030 [Oscillospiraceae bacterium]|jgi:hypothetical protein|nr:hypothetical protein [Oscillospiraceae bacterium]
MKVKKVDVSKVKQALTVKAITESAIVIGGGVALIALSYTLWGTLCAVAGLCGVISKAIEKKLPKQGQIILFVKFAVELTTVVAGGLTLVSMGQAAGGIACISVCTISIIEDTFLLPWVEKRYLTVLQII